MSFQRDVLAFVSQKTTAVSLENGHRASERAQGLSEIIVILTTTINGLMHQFVFMRDWIFFPPPLCYWIVISKKKKQTKKNNRKKNRFVAAALNE